MSAQRLTRSMGYWFVACKYISCDHCCMRSCHANYMGVSLNGGTPKDPKMVMFSRKTHGFVGETHHFRKPPSLQKTSRLFWQDEQLALAFVLFSGTGPQMSSPCHGFQEYMLDRNKIWQWNLEDVQDTFYSKGKHAQDYHEVVLSRHMDVSENSGTPKSSILIGFSPLQPIHFGVALFLDTPISPKVHFG